MTLLWPSTKRGFDGFFNRPPGVDPRCDMLSMLRRQFCHRLCLAAISNTPIIASVIVLYGFRNPAAILRAIVAVIVASIYLKPGFPAGAHVGVEVEKINPSRTHLYTPSSVAMIGVICFSAAPILHSTPDRINALRLSSSRHAVRGISENNSVDFLAPARLCIARAEGGAEENDYLSALTLAFPHSAGRLLGWVSHSGKRNNLEPAEFKPGHILYILRKLHPIILREKHCAFNSYFP